MNIKEAKFVTVHFPEFKSRIKSQCSPATIKTFSVGKRDNYKRGILSRVTFESNVLLWQERGYEMKIW